VKLTDLQEIPDDHSLAQFVQAIRFLDALALAENEAREIRDSAIVRLLDDPELEMSQRKLAKQVGLSQQRIQQIYAQAKQRQQERLTL